MEPHTRTELDDLVAPGHTALLVIDMQKDFCTPGFGTSKAGRDLTATRAIIPSIARLLDAARAAGVLVCHIGFSTLPHHLSSSGPWLAQRRRSTVSADNLCPPGTEGAEFIDELAPRDGEPAIHKHRYSGFKGTDLATILRARRIETCVLTGVSTNVCVESTTREAFELDHYVVVPEDGVASWDMDLHAATLQTIRHRFGTVTTAGAVAQAWRAQAGAANAAE